MAAKQAAVGVDATPASGGLVSSSKEEDPLPPTRAGVELRHIQRAVTIPYGG